MFLGLGVAGLGLLCHHVGLHLVEDDLDATKVRLLLALNRLPLMSKLCCFKKLDHFIKSKNINR